MLIMDIIIKNQFQHYHSVITLMKMQNAAQIKSILHKIVDNLNGALTIDFSSFVTSAMYELTDFKKDLLQFAFDELTSSQSLHKKIAETKDANELFSLKEALKGIVEKAEKENLEIISPEKLKEKLQELDKIINPQPRAINNPNSGSPKFFDKKISASVSSGNVSNTKIHNQPNTKYVNSKLDTVKPNTKKAIKSSTKKSSSVKPNTKKYFNPKFGR